MNHMTIIGNNITFTGEVYEGQTIPVGQIGTLEVERRTPQGDIMWTVRLCPDRLRALMAMTRHRRGQRLVDKMPPISDNSRG